MENYFETPYEFKPPKTDDYNIALTEEDPLKRLDELCAAPSPFKHSFSWWKFQNGYMMSCTLYVGLGKAAKVSHFVPGTSLDTARHVIASKLLYTIGLSPLESACGEDAEVAVEGTSENADDFSTVDDVLMGVIDELTSGASSASNAPDASNSSPSSNDQTIETANPIIAQLCNHLTPEQLRTHSGLVAMAGSAFSSLPDEAAKQQALNLFTTFASSLEGGSLPNLAAFSNLAGFGAGSSSTKPLKITEEIHDLE